MLLRVPDLAVVSELRRRKESADSHAHPRNRKQLELLVLFRTSMEKWSRHLLGIRIVIVCPAVVYRDRVLIVTSHGLHGASHLPSFRAHVIVNPI